MLIRTLRRLAARLTLRSARFAGDVAGATAIEYALIAALISMAIIAGLTLVSTSLQSVFQAIAGGFSRT